MKKSECKVGMFVGFKSDIECYGQVTKLKPTVAVVEVYDATTGDYTDYEISYNRLWKGDE